MGPRLQGRSFRWPKVGATCGGLDSRAVGRWVASAFGCASRPQRRLGLQRRRCNSNRREASPGCSKFPPFTLRFVETMHLKPSKWSAARSESSTTSDPPRLTPFHPKASSSEVAV